MNQLSRNLVQILFAFIVVFLAGIAAVFLDALFHLHSQLIFGVTFFASIVFLLFTVERMLPSVYRGSRTREAQWWQNRGVVAGSSRSDR